MLHSSEDLTEGESIGASADSVPRTDQLVKFPEESIGLLSRTVDRPFPEVVAVPRSVRPVPFSLLSLLILHTPVTP